MKSRNALFSALTLGLMLSAPLAFAQEQTTPAADPAAQATEAAPAEAVQPAAPAATPEQTAAPTAAAQPEGEAKQITWSDLDADKDGKLTKTEASPVQALSQVFDDADADKDGALTPDEYKAFVAKSQGEAAQQAPQNEG